MSEEPRSTWDKRFKARHYAYRDFHAAVTAAVPATYVFGTNARAVSRRNWPIAGDYASGSLVPRQQCYAREVMVRCTEDCWVALTCINPEYLILLAQGHTAAQIAALSVPQTITEVAQPVPAGDYIRLFPTYGYAVTFYQDTASGAIMIWVEGNVEGGE